ncbi:MAG: prepilin-type N-terminal cleavage/methylation domain-containing protein, partial [Actinobacteria bacterium]|nr:prepilin-type N-terminal cleavage/methylation domain-containing protein [Actinomycetota bacterium]
MSRHERGFSLLELAVVAVVLSVVVAVLLNRLAFYQE